MQYLTEDPTLIVTMAVALLVLLGLGWVMTRRAVVLAIMAGVVLVAGGLLVVERLILTDSEQIELLVERAADAAEAGNWASFKSVLAPEAEELHRYASLLENRFDIELVAVGDQQIEVEPGPPPRGSATFLVRVQGSQKPATTAYQNYVGRFVVKLRKDGEQWLVTEARQEQGLGLPRP